MRLLRTGSPRRCRHRHLQNHPRVRDCVTLWSTSVFEAFNGAFADWQPEPLPTPKSPQAEDLPLITKQSLLEAFHDASVVRQPEPPPLPPSTPPSTKLPRGEGLMWCGYGASMQQLSCMGRRCSLSWVQIVCPSICL